MSDVLNLIEDFVIPQSIQQLLPISEASIKNTRLSIPDASLSNTLNTTNLTVTGNFTSNILNSKKSTCTELCINNKCITKFGINSIVDKRTDQSDLPSYYRTNYTLSSVKEYKNSLILNLALTGYCILETFVPTSEIPIKQILYNNDGVRYTRSSNDAMIATRIASAKTEDEKSAAAKLDSWPPNWNRMII